MATQIWPPTEHPSLLSDEVPSITGNYKGCPIQGTAAIFGFPKYSEKAVKNHDH